MSGLDHAGVAADEAAALLACILDEVSGFFEADVRLMLVVRPEGSKVGFCVGSESVEAAIATLEHYRDFVGKRVPA